MSELTTHKLTRYRAIEVKYKGPTNSTGSRIQFKDLYELDRMRTQTRDVKTKVTIGYDYEIGDVLTQAIRWLDDNGWKVKGFYISPDCYVVLCENFGDDYINF